jgi:hypothetical protein
MTSSPGNAFVIQEHTTPDGGHWDLMLQIGDVLWTWRLHHPPHHILDTPASIEKIADHPLRFLSYEGPVQNYTASVKIVDTGSFAMTTQTEREMEFEANGRILTGRFQLRHEQDDIWFLSRVG